MQLTSPQSQPACESPALALAPGSAPSADEIISTLEKHHLGWSLDHTGHLIEARVWVWPTVVGRYRPARVEPLADMLKAAIRDALDISGRYLTDGFIHDAKAILSLPNNADNPSRPKSE